MSPEMLENREYNCAKADLFSAAITLFNITTGQRFQFRQEIDDEFWLSYNGEHLSKEFKDLVSKMVSYDPSDRLSISQIKAHPWYQNKISIESSSSLDAPKSVEHSSFGSKELSSERMRNPKRNDSPSRRTSKRSRSCGVLSISRNVSS